MSSTTGRAKALPYRYAMRCPESGYEQHFSRRAVALHHIKHISRDCASAHIVVRQVWQDGIWRDDPRTTTTH